MPTKIFFCFFRQGKYMPYEKKKIRLSEFWILMLKIPKFPKKMEYLKYGYLRYSWKCDQELYIQ